MNQKGLSVTHLTKRFQSGDTEVVAVRDVSLSVQPGEVVLIMGPSGSGKSTLLLMLGGLLRPSEGSVSVDGINLTTMSESALPDVRLRRFGFVFQDFNLLSALTAEDNVAIVAQMTGVGRRSAVSKAETLLEELGLGHRKKFLPEKLSGGEKQRVAIARALVNDPGLVLADEPTANLDSSKGHETMRLLREMAKEREKAVVIVSHDERIKDIADRVLWMADGQFADAVAMAVDPVCGMAVERDKAFQAERGTVTFYFCSKGCRREYFEAPTEPSLNDVQVMRPAGRGATLPEGID